MKSYLNPKRQTVILSVLTVIFGGLFLYQTVTAKQSKSDPLKTVKDTPGKALTVDNSLGAPITVTEGLAKEISNADFRTLTGAEAKAAISLSYPETKLLNTSGKVVTGFALALQMNDGNGSYYWTKHSDLKIGPNESFSISAIKWVAGPRTTTRTRDGKLEKVALDYNSPEMWIPGQASNATLAIWKVTFSDGTSWKVNNN